MSQFPKDNVKSHSCDKKPNVRKYRDSQYIIATYGDWYYPTHACHLCITESFWFFYDSCDSVLGDSEGHPAASFSAEPEISGKLALDARDHFLACARGRLSTVGQCPVCASSNRVLWPVPCIDASIEMAPFRPEFLMTENSPEILNKFAATTASPGDAPQLSIRATT
jgi:hypothetical protein